MSYASFRPTYSKIYPSKILHLEVSQRKVHFFLMCHRPLHCGMLQFYGDFTDLRGRNGASS